MVNFHKGRLVSGLDLQAHKQSFKLQASVHWLKGVSTLVKFKTTPSVEHTLALRQSYNCSLPL